VPKGVDENREYRFEARARAFNNPLLQRQLRQRCRDDILYYVNAWVWQYNPQKKRHEVGPFLTWDFQDRAFREILDCIETGRDLVIEKSREMGASWMCLIVMEWLWHFHPYKKFLCISRNADAVDCDDPDSLFWKIDFIHKHLPPWLMPKGWDARKHRKGMYYGNPENGSTITGQASTGKAGVGGRATAMFVDEFSQIREDYEVLHRTADTTACRIFNFTHTDVSNAAAELSRRVDMRKLRLHWCDHPDKNPGLYRYNTDSGKVDVLDKHYDFGAYDFQMDGKLRSPWYDRECIRRNSPRAIAMDLDIDPRGAMSQFFDPMTVRILSQEYAQPPLWEGELTYDRETGKPIQLVKREGGRLKLWVNPIGPCAVPPLSCSVGCDIATGSGASCSCAEGLNKHTGEQVFEYADPTIEPVEFAKLCVALCWLFCNEHGDPARLAWEMQGPGDKFGKVVVDELGFRNVYYRVDEQILGSVGDPDRPGWNPTPGNIRLMLEDIRAAMASHALLIRSEPAYDECLSFKYNTDGSVTHSGKSRKDDPSGARVNHGDRITGIGLAWKMAKGIAGGKRKGEVQPEIPKVGSLAWRRQMDEERRKLQEVWA